MKIAGCLWSLPDAQVQAAQTAAAAGFNSIDVDPGFAAEGERGESLPVTCAAVAHLMPAGAALEAPDPSARRRAIDHVLAALDEAATLGAPVAYVGPPATGDARERVNYRSSMLRLAADAERRGIKLGIEHFPGRGLPTVSATLEFIRETAHPNLYLLLDIGHCLIAGEPLPASVAQAGDRLVYVHFDDNDGSADQHRGLLQGRLREADLDAAIQALMMAGYSGPLSVETSPRLDDPEAAFVGSLRILRQAIERVEAER